METLAAALLGLFTAGWFVLAGADLGVCMLLPRLARPPRPAPRGHDRRTVLAAITPFFLTSEVWLVAAAGVFVGCFPDVEGDLLQANYPVFLVLLTGWVLRDAGLWWRARGGAGWARCADALITGGAWAVAGAAGWLLAGLLHGDPLDPAPLLPGLAGALLTAALFAAHGRSFAALRLGGPPRRKPLAATAVVLAAAPLAAGARLPLHEEAAAGPVLGLLVPALLLITVFLLAAQVWTWRTFRGPVRGPSYL